MNSSRWDDLDLLLLAVQKGVLNDAQIEDCLRAWEEKRAVAGAAAPALQNVAIEMGYITEERLRTLVTEPSLPSSKGGSTVIRAQVAMTCPACDVEYTLSLEHALKQPRCKNCSGVLGVRKASSGTPSVRTTLGALPEEVQKAADDPRNRVSRYILLRKLGAGGMGEVHKGWDTVMQRAVALKFPRSMGEDEIRRLTVEAQSAGRLSHPNIASVYELGEADGRTYIAMQFIDGRTAEDAVAAMGARRDFREIARWIRDASLAAHYAHERDVIHRDLKPQNLMIDTEGRVFVMDFGLAKVYSSATGSTVSGMILGTPTYMPPEQASGQTQEIDRRSDVYALGSTLFVLLSGTKPYDGETVTDILIKIITTDPPPLRRLDPSIPWELEAVVEKAMRRAKDQRYSSAKDLADDLTRFLQGEAVQARRSTITYRMARKIRRHRSLILTGALCLALASALAFFLVARPSSPSAAGEDRLQAWSALFASLQDVLHPDRFQAAEASALLERARREFPEQGKAVENTLAGYHSNVQNHLESLPRERWLDSKDSVRRLRDWLAFLNRPVGKAEEILRYRGTCSLTVQVSPHAVLQAPFLEGVPEEDRSTPITIRSLEIVEADLELSHPDHPKKVLPLRDLRPGRRYLIEGTWSRPETIELKEKP